MALAAPGRWRTFVTEMPLPRNRARAGELDVGDDVASEASASEHDGRVNVGGRETGWWSVFMGM
jgi:hypothetical protein